VLFGALNGLVRGAFREARHPTGAGIALIVLAAVFLLVAFVRFRRRFSG
jgi:hypothetical protein